MNKIIVNNNIINSNFDLKINNNKIYIDKDTTIIYLNSNCSYEIYLSNNINIFEYYKNSYSNNVYNILENSNIVFNRFSFNCSLITNINLDYPYTSLEYKYSCINIDDNTYIININHNTKDINKADLCASFEKTVTEVLIENIRKAIEQTGMKSLAIAGGVSANSYIRSEILKLQSDDLKVYMPDLKLCTDNAAMIGSAGYYNFINGKIDELDLNAVPNLKL